MEYTLAYIWCYYYDDGLEDYIFTSLVPRPFFATQGKWSGEQPIPISFHMLECWQAN